MDYHPPLGEYEQLRGWAGRAMPWGPDGQWSMTLGSGAGVIDRLVDLIADGPRRVAAKYPGKAEAFTVTLGCVPWFTSRRVAAALVNAGRHCICVDKSAMRTAAVQTLLTNGRGVANYLVPDLRFTGRAGPDGSAPVIGPGTLLGEDSDERLEPIRMVGWASQDGKRLPILHAKLAVICAAWRWEGEAGGWDDFLTPLAAWWGSANWTEAAARHIEVGAWTTDKTACDTVLSFIVDVIRMSEAPTSTAARPEPDLVEAEWDDIAFAEYMAEFGDADLDGESDGHDGRW